MSEMIKGPISHENLLGQLPAGVQEQVKDILDRILKLAGYISNSNTDSNSGRGILIPSKRRHNNQFCVLAKQHRQWQYYLQAQGARNVSKFFNQLVIPPSLYLL
jgi:hypothetical protein